MMNILLISNMYPSKGKPYYGVFVKNSNDLLNLHGFNVTRVTLPVSKLSIFKFFSYFSFYSNIVKEIFFGKYDYIYVNYVSHCAIPLLICNKLTNLKIISHVHGGDVKLHSGRSKLFFKLKKYLSLRLLSNSYEVLVPSQYYKEYLNEFYGIKNAIIYPSGGVNLSIFNNNKMISFVQKIGFAGRLEAAKRVDWIINGFAIFAKNHRDASLEIVGTGSQKGKLVQLCKDLGIQEQVVFYDAKSQSELAEWYNSIDIIVYPSESESLGLVPLEAMACGVIPLLSNIPPFKEIITEGQNGFIVESFDDIAEKLKYISGLSNNKLLELSFNASSFVKYNYDSKKISEVLINVFR